MAARDLIRLELHGRKFTRSRAGGAWRVRGKLSGKSSQYARVSRAENEYLEWYLEHRLGVEHSNGAR